MIADDECDCLHVIEREEPWHRGKTKTTELGVEFRLVLHWYEQELHWNKPPSSFHDLQTRLIWVLWSIGPRNDNAEADLNKTEVTIASLAANIEMNNTHTVMHRVMKMKLLILENIITICEHGLLESCHMKHTLITVTRVLVSSLVASGDSEESKDGSWQLFLLWYKLLMRRARLCCVGEWYINIPEYLFSSQLAQLPAHVVNIKYNN